MKKIIKTLTCLVLLATMWCSAQTASAQSLVITFKDHSTVSVKMDNEFCISFSGDDILFSNSEDDLSYPKDQISSITKVDGTFGDMNYDELVDVADLGVLIDLMAGITPENTPRRGLEAVDLGLPSQRQWASTNVGATAENDYGLFFAWGDTEGYADNAEDGHIFDWASYKWMAEGKSAWEYINKYQYPSHDGEGSWYEYGVFKGDGLGALLTEDDAATAIMGEEWRMPTAEEVDELIKYTTQEWIQLKGIWGCKFTGENGNYIFLPAAGYREFDFVAYVNELTGEPIGKYWSKTVYDHKPANAVALSLEKKSGSNAIVEKQFISRSTGLNIRPVYDK